MSERTSSQQAGARLDRHSGRSYKSVYADKSVFIDIYMPPKNSADFPKRDKELARIAKALSAPAKISILRALAKRSTCICGEIVDITPLSQSTVSQHLKELKELGLIQGRIEGVKSCYWIDEEGFSKFRGQLSGFLDEICVASALQTRQKGKCE